MLGCTPIRMEITYEMSPKSIGDIVGQQLWNECQTIAIATDTVKKITKKQMTQKTAIKKANKIALGTLTCQIIKKATLKSMSVRFGYKPFWYKKIV